MKALEKLLLASSWAALAVGPKDGTPAAVRSSTMPGKEQEGKRTDTQKCEGSKIRTANHFTLQNRPETLRSKEVTHLPPAVLQARPQPAQHYDPYRTEPRCCGYSPTPLGEERDTDTEHESSASTWIKSAFISTAAPLGSLVTLEGKSWGHHSRHVSSSGQDECCN